MSETEPSPETPHYTREQVVAALKKLAERGVAHPDDLPLDDPEVAAAHEMFFAWNAQAERQAEQNPAPGAIQEHNLSGSTVEVDAGFTDPDYLAEVANDWLASDQQDAEDLGLPELAARIQAKRDEINARL